MLAADTGVEVARSEPASTSLLDDLRSDKHMGWVPDVDVAHLLRRVDPGRRAAPRPRGVDARRDAAVGPHGGLRRCRRPTAPATGGCRSCSWSRRSSWSPAAVVLARPARVVTRRLRGSPAGGLDGRRWCSSSLPAPARRVGERRCQQRRAARRRARTRPRDRAHRRRPQPLHPASGPAPVRVRPHTEVRFVVVNHDPIGHELIVGGPDVQARHASGHEAYHPPVAGRGLGAGRRPRVHHVRVPRARARSSTPATSRATTSTACTGSWR